MSRPRYPARIAKWQFWLRFVSLLTVASSFLSWIIITCMQGSVMIHAWVGIMFAIGIDASECITLRNQSRTRRRLPNIAILSGDFIVMTYFGWAIENYFRREGIWLAGSETNRWAPGAELLMTFALLFLRLCLFTIYSVQVCRQRKQRSTKQVQDDALPFAGLRAVEPNSLADPVHAAKHRSQDSEIHV